ncbi:MAG: hypothetical protein IPP47_00595 [Bryobacterales bacterium]|nr:hypothetical protein [Bryobacterales bacterium]
MRATFKTQGFFDEGVEFSLQRGLALAQLGLLVAELGEGVLFGKLSA